MYPPKPEEEGQWFQCHAREGTGIDSTVLMDFSGQTDLRGPCWALQAPRVGSEQMGLEDRAAWLMHRQCDS
eukprot:7226566-Pyramimonas_sp.AAC.1